MKKTDKEVYISKDGKVFISEEECRDYEAMLKNIEFFCINCEPDLTETGIFKHKIYVAVYSEYTYHREIAIEWAIRKFKGYLGQGVQGVRCQPMFKVCKCSSYAYDEALPLLWGMIPLKSEKIFLSPKEIKGFPKNYDYTKEWGFNY